MFRWLRQPFPLPQHPLRQAIPMLLVSVFVALFLIIFQPFGISTITSEHKLWELAGYGLVTFLASLLMCALDYLLTRRMDERRWTVGAEMLSVMLVVLLIAAGNMWYTHFLGYGSVSLRSFFSFIGITAAVAVFPVTASVLLRYIRLLKANVRMAEAMNTSIPQAETKPEISRETQQEEWRFISENGKEEFRTNVSSLLFIESADNYSTFHYLEGGQLKKKMLRGSLTRMEGQVSSPALFRSHRACIVNLEKVLSVSGNSQGYRLRLQGTDAEAPVARNYGKSLQQRLENLKR